VVNEDSRDIDFRVESDASANALFVQGSSGNVGIGVSPTTSYGNALQIHDTGTSGANLRLTDNTSGSGTGNGFEIIQIGVNNYMLNRENGFIAAYTNNAERMRIDSSGNVGIGAVPVGYSSALSALQLGGNANIAAESSTGASQFLHISQNANFDTDNSWEYISTDEATSYYQNNGTHVWRYAASGTAGNDISWSEAMRIDSSGNVGIGTGSPDNVGSTTALTINRASGNGQLSLMGNGTVYGRIFADNATGDLKMGNPTSNDVMFYTANTERMRIDSSGNLQLDPNNVGNKYLNLNTSASGDGHIILNRGGSNKWQITSGTTNALQFYNYTAGSESMRIDSSGNVGIGELSVDSKFHVKDSLASTGVGSSSSPIAIIQNERTNTGTSSSVLRFDTNEIAGTQQHERAAIGAEYDGSSDVNGRLMFSTADTSGNLQEAMRIDSAGAVTMPAQPAFHSGLSTNTSSITSGSTVVFNSTYVNRGNHYDTSTGIFTAPVAGFYSFTTRLLHQGVSNGHAVDSMMSKNNSASQGYSFLMQRHKYQANYTGHTGYLAEGTSAMIYLAAGDTFRVKYGGAQNTVIHGNPSWSYFCGHLVG